MFLENATGLTLTLKGTKMSSLVYRSFQGRRREPLVDKVIRDGEKMYEFARHVLVVDTEGNIVEKLDHRCGTQFLNCVAVLGPVSYKDKKISRAVLLEIGLKRFVPYTNAEFFTDGTVNKVPARTPIARLSDEIMLGLLPYISGAVQDEVDTIIGSWEKTVPFFMKVTKSQTMSGFMVDHTYEMPQQIFIKVPKEEHVLCTALMLSERAWKTGTKMHYDIIARSTKEKLQNFLKLCCVRDVDHITDEKIKKANTCWIIARMFFSRIKFRGYKQHAMDHILVRIGDEHSAERRLLERIFELHKVPQAPVEKMLQFENLPQHHGINLLTLLGGLICFRSTRHEEKRKKHAANCLVFTVLGSQDKMEKLMQKHMLAKATSSEASASLEDEIPF